MLTKIKLYLLKRKFRKKLIRYREIVNNYDCGINMVHKVNVEARILSLELDKLFKQLKEIDFDNCPENWGCNE